MFRAGFSVLRVLQPLPISYYRAARIVTHDIKNYATLNKFEHLPKRCATFSNGLLTNNKQILAISNNITAVPARTVTKFSLTKGKRKTCKAVIKRFFRLHWGAWIRPKVGSKKRMWKKSPQQRRRLKQHVFCNATQSTLLDKMVTKYWKRPRYYVDDPYAPYHTREEFFITKRKPV